MPVTQRFDLTSPVELGTTESQQPSNQLGWLSGGGGDGLGGGGAGMDEDPLFRQIPSDNTHSQAGHKMQTSRAPVGHPILSGCSADVYSGPWHAAPGGGEGEGGGGGIGGGGDGLGGGGEGCEESWEGGGGAGLGGEGAGGDVRPIEHLLLTQEHSDACQH